MTQREIIIDPHDTDELPYRLWRPGVTGRVLWKDERGHSYAGLLHLEPGADIPPHTHHYAVHHLWVAQGSCSVDSRDIPQGSYLFVPAEAKHGVDAAGPQGCTLFYLYLVADLD